MRVTAQLRKDIRAAALPHIHGPRPALEVGLRGDAVEPNALAWMPEDDLADMAKLGELRMINDAARYPGLWALDLYAYTYQGPNWPKELETNVYVLGTDNAVLLATTSNRELWAEVKWLLSPHR